MAQSKTACLLQSARFVLEAEQKQSDRALLRRRILIAFALLVAVATPAALLVR